MTNSVELGTRVKQVLGFRHRKVDLAQQRQARSALEAELVLALVPGDKDEVFQLQEEYEVV